MAENVNFKSAFKDIVYSPQTLRVPIKVDICERNVQDTDCSSHAPNKDDKSYKPKVTDLFALFKIELEKTCQKPENKKDFKQKKEKLIAVEELEKKVYVEKDQQEEVGSFKLQLLNNKYWTKYENNEQYNFSNSVQRKNNKKNEKKKNKIPDDLELQEEELDIKNIFITRKFLRNVHSSGPEQRYAADESHFLAAEREAAKSKRKLRVATIDDIVLPSPPPSPVPDIRPQSPTIFIVPYDAHYYDEDKDEWDARTFDEKPWDDDWVPWYNRFNAAYFEEQWTSRTFDEEPWDADWVPCHKRQ